MCLIDNCRCWKSYGEQIIVRIQPQFLWLVSTQKQNYLQISLHGAVVSSSVIPVKTLSKMVCKKASPIPLSKFMKNQIFTATGLRLSIRLRYLVHWISDPTLPADLLDALLLGSDVPRESSCIVKTDSSKSTSAVRKNTMPITTAKRELATVQVFQAETSDGRPSLPLYSKAQVGWCTSVRVSSHSLTQQTSHI